ncbi:MAG TPA: class I SAM-dependent methyltransferase [Planctomycetota bacterium]|nr:class I SAM-dependent methyltransferase [Planctomycetota bacterium]
MQSPERVVALLLSIHGASPRALGEDFCGTAAVSRAWVRIVPGGSAVAVDLDAGVLERAAGDARIELVHGDACNATDPARHRADVIFVGNFSIGEIGERPGLVRYLSRARERLDAHGIFVCDTYAGPSSLRVGAVERSHWIEGGARILYVWEQREFDPCTSRAVNAMHFRVERDGEIVQSIEDAFVYRWRLWSVPELRDAMAEAGFAATEVVPMQPSADAAEGFIPCVVGRTDPR